MGDIWNNTAISLNNEVDAAMWDLRDLGGPDEK